MPRLFVAVEVPASVRSAVAASVEPLREALPRLRWVDPAKYHLTVVFLGSVEEPLVGAVAGAVASACGGVAPFELSLSGEIGTFGRRVLWAGLAPAPELSALAGSVSAALREVVSLPDDDRPYSAHLTLARAGREPVRGAALREAQLPALSWTVERVVLMRSAGGYTVEQAYPLAAGNA